MFENALASIYDAYSAIRKTIVLADFFPEPLEGFGCPVPIKIKTTRQF